MVSKRVAFIPARKGSKRLPEKNTKLLHGKPMIEYTIEAAMGCKFLHEIVICTNDTNIMNLCQKYYTDSRVVIYIEPEELAQDNSKLHDVVKDTFKDYDKETVIIYLQPTSPLRTTGDINRAFALYLETNNNGIIPGYWNPFEKVITLNGAVFIMTLGEIIENNAVMVENPTVYIFPRERCVDVDTLDEFKEVERLMQRD